MNTIGIIDYGMGNLRSVQKACERVGARAEICPTPDLLMQHSRWILPGVGAFRDAIAALRTQGFVDSIRKHVEQDRPLLGICLGLQLLFETGYEDGQYEGLGLVPGDVVRFNSAPGLKIPHMGWNGIEFQHPNPLLKGLASGDQVYFVHSYHVRPTDSAVVATETEHGQRFVSMIARGQLFATQFHPEKSQRVGLQILENFTRL